MAHAREAALGPFEAIGRALDESAKIALDLASGRLTRAQVDEWYERRRAESDELASMARERAAGMMQPVQSAIGVGRDVLQGMAPRSASTRHRRRRRSSR